MDAFRLQLSAEILDETMRILADKFHWPAQDITEVRAVLSAISQRVIPHVQLDVVKRDPDDNRVLECAPSSASDYIVTGDKDLLDLKHHAGARILRPVEFLVLLRTRLGPHSGFVRLRTCANLFFELRRCPLLSVLVDPRFLDDQAELDNARSGW